MTEGITTFTYTSLKEHDAQVAKKERMWVLDEILIIKEHTDFFTTSDRLKFERDIESLRGEP